MQAQKLSPLQLELLKVYSFQPKEEDLMAIKRLMAQYFADKLRANIGQAMQDKNLSEADLDKWIDE
ncbi:hypothetical protein [Parapedobacter soli]|uniref:hypothetical protein n=1 Tax=Parapedobacter soli TaxID=416955 RepID=UPI0021C5EFB5|nr:hypothetical protein [Parapedobacter soli]